MQQASRLYSLDNLRAMMMWLGIVLHVALNHMTVSKAVPWKDGDTSVIADLVFLFIHAFRMPVFFILAGYFVALLVNNRGYDGMLRHRLRRIALPFLIFWPILFFATVSVVMIYLHVMAHGTIGFDPALMPKETADRATINTMHLWFLYYLLWLCVLTAAMGLLVKYIPTQLRALNQNVWKALGSRWWGFIVLAIPLAAVGSFYPGGLVAPNGSFVPHVAELIHNGLFFVFGWYLYSHRESLIPLYANYWRRHATVGFLFFILSLMLFAILGSKPKSIPHIEAYIALTYSCTSWLWSFALIGLFVRFLPRQNPVLQYVSESSYWVYLVHMLGTIGFGALIFSLPVGAVPKMAINIILTSAACLATYQLLVRNTWVGVLLNGRRRSRKLRSLLATGAR